MMHQIQKLFSGDLRALASSETEIHSQGSPGGQRELEKAFV